MTTSDTHNQLSAKGLHKRYGKRWVVRDVDLDVNKGEIVGLLGPNGAGKTTTGLAMGERMRNKKIIYLTFSAQLKLEGKEKVKKYK